MKKILAVDIGGTNSRFAKFNVNENNILSLEKDLWLKTADVSSFEHLLSTASEQIDINNNDIMVFGVPGPVEFGTYANLVNVPWKEVDISSLKERAEKKGIEVHLINDFVSQAFGCINEEIANVKDIKHAKPNQFLGFSVVGAGTGLGHCTLISNDDGSFREIPSEAGQIVFPFLTKQEIEYRDFAAKQLQVDSLRNDDVVSGSGLAMLHHYITGRSLSPVEVSKEIGPQSETTKLFARFFARSCRNYVLALLPVCSALYIAGGVAGHLPFLVDNDVFRDEFINSTKGKDLNKIPIKLCLNEQLGIWGSALYGLECLKMQSIN